MFSKPAINNDIYNQYADGWWNENSFLNILETGIQPLRSSYVRTCLDQYKLESPVCLDVGCGGGIITEDLAKISDQVFGVDISGSSLNTARLHAEQNELKINYQKAYAENLPFESDSFDLVTCCDVLEHVDDVDKAISEIARVLKPGGVFVYDTVNRTLFSYLSLIFVAQDFPLTRFAPKNAHVWHKFIRPAELQMSLDRHGLSKAEEHGMAPSVNNIKMIWYIIKAKYFGLNFAKFGEKTKFQISKNNSISYLGHCTKRIEHERLKAISKDI